MVLTNSLQTGCRSLHRFACRRPLLGLGLVFMLSACGGAPGGSADPVLISAPDAPAAATPQKLMGPPTAAATAAAQPTGEAPRAHPVPAGSYALVIFNKQAVHRDDDELRPLHGAGYETLRAFVYQGGQPRSRSPVAGVKPYCATPLQCEYLPPRKAGTPEKYTIALDDDSIATLGAMDDLVVIRARQLAVAKPLKLKVTLTIAGQETLTRQVIYAQAES